jgi:hypothetical protein
MAWLAFVPNSAVVALPRAVSTSDQQLRSDEKFGTPGNALVAWVALSEAVRDGTTDMGELLVLKRHAASRNHCGARGS